MINLNDVKDTRVRNIILVSDGGLGKVIASTAIVKRLSEEFPDKRIIVVTGYPDVFLHNPRVYKVFRFDNPLYFYDDYITPESYVIKVEPYTAYDYIVKNRHLIDVWCEMIGIERNGAMPELFYPDNEIEAGKLYVEKLTGNKKKFILLQWTGGIVPQDKNESTYLDSQLRMHRRSLPKNIAQKLVNKLVSRDFVVGLVQHENYPDLQGDGVVRIMFPIRQVIALLKHSRGFIGIDSFLHHAAAAFDAKGVVIWGGTSPERLGYEKQKNLTKQVCKMPFCHRPDSYLFDMNPANGMWNCSYNQACLDHDADEIIKAYESLFEEVKDEAGV
jgi:ADP-heptose:LPS heptosyltransferase